MVLDMNSLGSTTIHWWSDLRYSSHISCDSHTSVEYYHQCPNIQAETEKLKLFTPNHYRLIVPPNILHYIILFRDR